MTGNVLYWIATAPIGAASVLAEELAQFGATDIRERSHDVKFQGTLEVGYRACLWSRAATRVLLSLGSIEAESAAGIHAAIMRIDWREHLAPGATLACECSGGNAAIRHTIYGSQLLKDAVCDSCAKRPASVRTSSPNARTCCCICTSRAPRRWSRWISPARACIGAAIASKPVGRLSRKTSPRRCCCARAGPALYAAGGTLVDPMCGSGTFLTEAALIAADAAPALGREYFGFLGWRGHDAALWETLLRRGTCAPRRARAATLHPGLRHRCGCRARRAR